MFPFDDVIMFERRTPVHERIGTLGGWLSGSVKTVVN